MKTTSRPPREMQNLKNAKPEGRKTTSSQPKTTTVLFVEQTPGGALARMFREAETSLAELTGFRVKIAEKNGNKAIQLLHKSNPWAEGICGRESCLPCDTGDTKCCFKRNIVYKSSCILCKKEGKESVYIGESSRSSHERGAEHLDDFHKHKQDSHMRKHTENSHPQEHNHNFEFKVIQSFSSALMRQITEAVLIRRQGGTVLNSKGVYNRCHLPRLTVENGNKKEEVEGNRKNQAEDSQVEVGEDWGQWENSNNNKRFAHPNREVKANKKAKIRPKPNDGRKPTPGRSPKKKNV